MNTSTMNAIKARIFFSKKFNDNSVLEQLEEVKKKKKK